MGTRLEQSQFLIRVPSQPSHQRTPSLLSTHQQQIQTRLRQKRISLASCSKFCAGTFVRGNLLHHLIRTDVRNDFEPSNSSAPFWAPSLPEGVQRHIAILAAHLMEKCRNSFRSSRGSLRLINSSGVILLNSPESSSNSELRYRRPAQSHGCLTTMSPIMDTAQILSALPNEWNSMAMRWVSG